MIDIKQGAQEYFLKLLQQQEADGLGLRIQVLQPGTPSADCDRSEPLLSSRSLA